MDSSAEFWREPNTNSTVSGSSPMQVLKDSVNTNNNNDKTGSGRRSSDGGPPPFNRTRSFKTKQLVRSQAIRESQSPPRVPSPRPGHDSKDPKILTVKMKSASVDLDDRLSYDNYQSQRNDSSDFNEAVLQMKSANNDAVSLTNPDSFKNVNLSSKNVLVSSSGDKNLLGANVLSISSSMSECKNSDIISDNINGITEKTDYDEYDKNDCAISSVQQTDNNTDDEMDRHSNTEPDDMQYDVKCLSIGNDFSSIDIDSNKDLGHSNNNNDKCLSLDISTTCTEAKNIQSTNDTQDSINYHDECKNYPSDYTKKQRVTLKNLKNSNFAKNDIGTLAATHDREQNYNSAKIEFPQVEIQVTLGDKNDHDIETQTEKSSLHYDCEIDPSLDDTEFVIEKSNSPRQENDGRRAIFSSKQDSGICCWDSYCGDVSPEIITSDTEEDTGKYRKQRTLTEYEHHCHESCRCLEKERWSNRRNGSMLTVQKSGSSGNSRLLRKQSSGGSIDSGQHSITSPYLSRDNSADVFSMNPYDTNELSRFIKDTLNKSQKDRIALLKIEHELISFIKDPSRREFRYPATSSYGRLLIHRCADLFGLRHGIDPVIRYIVTITKLPNVSVYRLPAVCPFQQWCTAKFPASPTEICEAAPQAKSILKRDTHSLDEDSVLPAPAPPKLLQAPRSKSFEQREEEYVKARRRIFSSSGQENSESCWDWEENKENNNENELCTPQILVPLDSSRCGKLLKVQSFEHETMPTTNRGVVSKAHSFGGYGGRQGVQRGDSITSTSSAPPHRILSRQGEIASSNWRLSPSSSGYKTLSGRSDSITPSPTSTPNTVDTTNTKGSTTESNAVNVAGGVLWAITDMSTVPTGAVIIHPKSGQPLINSDGSVYHFDPKKPLHTALLPASRTTSTENIRVLTNPERRRRLEKQRATLSPGTDYNSNSEAEQKPEDYNNDTTKPVKDGIHDINNDVDDKKLNIHPIDNMKNPVQLNGNIKTNGLSTSDNCDYLNENSDSKSNSFNGDYNTDQSFVPEDLSSKPTVNIEYNNNLHSTVENNNGEFVNDAFQKDVKNNDDVNNAPEPEKKQSPYHEYEKPYDNSSNLTQIEHYERITDNNSKNSCGDFDTVIDERHMENFAPQYSEMQDPRYYPAFIQGHPQQFYQPGHLYDGNTQEIYATGPPQPMNYVRPNETPLTMPPHLIYTHQPDANMEFSQSGELCYPTPQAQVLIPPQTYRIHEQESQAPYVIPTDQQPVVVALSNKLPEHEMAPQPIASYPINYHPQVERAPLLAAPPLVGVTAPHPTIGYQIQPSSGWGCWPQVTVYPSPSNGEDNVPKFQTGTFVPQPTEGSMNPANVPAIPQAFFAHSNFIQAQPNQYFSSYPHPTPIIQHQFPVYQQYNPGRNSVLSQEGCSTPGYQSYDPNVNAFTFPKPAENTVMNQDVVKGRPNVRSPKHSNSRAASTPGSSRTTPLTGNVQPQNVIVGDVNFPTIDQNMPLNNIHFIHPTINYIPITYPYMNPECQQINEGSQPINQNKPVTTDNSNIIKYNKPLNKENEKPKTIPKSVVPKNEHTDNDQDKGIKSPRQVAIPNIDNTINKSVVNNITTNNINKNKDKRKAFKPLNSSDNFEKTEFHYDAPLKSPPTKDKPLMSQNYHMQPSNQTVPTYSNERNNSFHNKNGIRPEDRNIHNKHFSTPMNNNETKPFLLKNQRYHISSQWNVKDGHDDANVHNNKNGHMAKNGVDDNKQWKKTTFIPREYHNFPKNLNRQNGRNTMMNNGFFDKDKFFPKYPQKDRVQYYNSNSNQRTKHQSNFESSQSTIHGIPTVLNTPQVPWNHRNSPTQSNIHFSGAQNSNENPVRPYSNQSLPKHVRSSQQQNDSPTPSAPNTPSGVTRVNPSSKQSNTDVGSSQQHRFVDANLMSLPLTQGAAFYQRTQTLHNLTAGNILLSTPPLPGHPGYLLRQMPSGWLRRPVPPALFGPAPPLSGQIRQRPPRPHQSRQFYH